MKWSEDYVVPVAKAIACALVDAADAVQGENGDHEEVFPIDDDPEADAPSTVDDDLHDAPDEVVEPSPLDADRMMTTESQGPLGVVDVQPVGFGSMFDDHKMLISRIRGSGYNSCVEAVYQH